MRNLDLNTSGVEKKRGDGFAGKSASNGYGLAGMLSTLLPTTSSANADNSKESWKQKYDHLMFSHTQEIQSMQNDMTEMVKNVHGEIGALHNRATTLTQMLAQSNDTIERQNEHIASLQQQITSVMAASRQKTIGSLQDETDKYHELDHDESEELQSLRQDLNRSDGLVHDLRIAQKNMTQDLGQSIQRQNRREDEWALKLSAEIDCIGQTLNETEQRHACELVRFQNEADKLQQECANLTTAPDQMQLRVSSDAKDIPANDAIASAWQQKLEEAQMKAELSDEKRRELENQLTSVKNDLTQTRFECDTVRLAAESQRAALEQCQRTVKEIDTIRAEQARTAQEQAAADAECKQLRDRLKAVSDQNLQLKRTANETDELRYQRDQQAMQLNRRQAECMKLESKLEDAMEIIERNQEMMASAKSSIEQLGSTHSMQQEQIEQHARDLQAKIAEIADLKQAVQRKHDQLQSLNATSSELERLNVCLKLEIARQRQAVDDHERQALDNHWALGERQQRIEQLEAAALKLQQLNADLELKLNQQCEIASEHQIHALENDRILEDQKKKIQQQEARAIQQHQQDLFTQREMTALCEKIAQLQRQHEEAVDERQRLQVAQKQATRDARDQMTALNTELRQRQQDDNEQRRVISELRITLQEKSTTVTTLQLDHNRGMAEHKQASSLDADRIKQLSGECDRLRYQVEEFKRVAEDAKFSLRDAREQIETLDGDLQGAKKQLAELDGVVNGLRATLNAKEAAIAQRRSESDQMTEQLADSLEQSKDHRAAIHALKQDGWLKADQRTALAQQTIAQQAATDELSQARSEMQARHPRKSDEVDELNAVQVDDTGQLADELPASHNVSRLTAARNDAGKEAARNDAGREAARQRNDAMKLERQKAIGSCQFTNEADASQDAIRIDANPEEQIARLSLQLHETNCEKTHLNNRIVELDKEVKDLRRRIGSKSAMFESVLKTQLDKAIKFATADATMDTRPKSTLGSMQSSISTMCTTQEAWDEVQERLNTGPISEQSGDTIRMDRHRRNLSMGSTKKPWKV